MTFGIRIELTIKKPPKLHIVKLEPKPDTEKDPSPQDSGKG